jgi:diguanylate cyclase (GGDEF)-like protein
VNPLVELFDAFGAGLYVLLGATHLDLWLRRRSRRGHLWLAGASAFALLVDLTGMAIRRAPGQDVPPLAVVNLLGAAGTCWCLFELVGALGRLPTRPAARALEGLGFLLAPFAALDLPGAVPAAFACWGALLFWTLVRAFRISRPGQPGIRIVARAMVVLLACLLADVAMNLDLLPNRPGLPLLGFAILFLASARSLNDQMDREQRELEELRRDLERRVEERTLELQEASARLAEASRTDALTGLPNRRGFLEVSAHALERVRRTGRPASLALGDIDHFKQINDTYGHAAGDEVLRRVGSTIRGALRGQDLIARWGGEEFILLFPDTGLTGAAQAAETVRAAVDALVVEHEGARLAVTISLGVAEHAHGRALEASLAAADAALYRAKQEGRDRVVLASVSAAPAPSRTISEAAVPAPPRSSGS